MTEGIERLDKIKTELNELISEAFSIVQNEGSARAIEEARLYWVGHMRSAIGNIEYPTRAITLAKTIKDLIDTADYK